MPFFCPTTSHILLIPASIIIINTGSRVPDIRLQLQRSPNRLPRRAYTLADLRHPRSALQRRFRRMEALFADNRGGSRQGDGHEP